MKCRYCGADLRPDDKFCPKCGSRNIDYKESGDSYTYRSPSDNPGTDASGKNEDKAYDAYASQGSPSYTASYNRPVYIYKEETSTLGILAIIFSALGGFIGIILDIVGLCTYKKPENKKLCKIGLGIFLGWVVLYLILLIVHFCNSISY